MGRDYGNYSGETTIITKFEEYEESMCADYGDVWEDFGEWFLCFRAGFLGGGQN